MINVTKSFLPPISEYQKYVEEIWERGYLTNHGPLVLELEEKIRNYLGVKHFYFLSNGTIALQIAIKALDLKGEIITTPFSYVATTSSIVWENAVPVFVDINPNTLTIDPDKAEEAITQNTTAILATHVYGIPCDVIAIEQLAKRYNLKVIYDAAHAFGVEFNNQSVLNYGDISTLSFHATKLFHTVEGGGIATNDDALAHRVSYMRNFGHNGQEDFFGLGINGKNSELHAAMGLCNFPWIEKIINDRLTTTNLYEGIFSKLNITLRRPQIPPNTKFNYAYYPVLFKDEKQLLRIRDALNQSDIFPRRYFYPTLNKLPYVNDGNNLMNAQTTASVVLCLPLYSGLEPSSVEHICLIIKENL